MRAWFLAFAWLLAVPAAAQPSAAPAFRAVPLGVKGGLAEGNLSAYLVVRAGSPDFIALDAGSLRPSAEKAGANHVFSALVQEVLGVVKQRGENCRVHDQLAYWLVLKCQRAIRVPQTEQPSSSIKAMERS